MAPAVAWSTSRRGPWKQCGQLDPRKRPGQCDPDGPVEDQEAQEKAAVEAALADSSGVEEPTVLDCEWTSSEESVVPWDYDLDTSHTFLLPPEHYDGGEDGIEVLATADGVAPRLPELDSRPEALHTSRRMTPGLRGKPLCRRLDSDFGFSLGEAAGAVPSLPLDGAPPETARVSFKPSFLVSSALRAPLREPSGSQRNSPVAQPHTQDMGLGWSGDFGSVGSESVGNEGFLVEEEEEEDWEQDWDGESLEEKPWGWGALVVPVPTPVPRWQEGSRPSVPPLRLHLIRRNSPGFPIGWYDYRPRSEEDSASSTPCSSASSSSGDWSPRDPADSGAGAGRRSPNSGRARPLDPGVSPIFVRKHARDPEDDSLEVLHAWLEELEVGERQMRASLEAQTSNALDMGLAWRKQKARVKWVEPWNSDVTQTSEASRRRRYNKALLLREPGGPSDSGLAEAARTPPDRSKVCCPFSPPLPRAKLIGCFTR